MPKVYQLSEVDPGDIVGDERLYVAVDPTGTPQDAYVTLDTIAAYIGLGGALLDEDDFASDSDTKAPSQQSTKAYVDAADDTKADKYQTINAQSGTSYTLVLTDADKLVTCDNGSPFTLTVPPDVFPVGTRIDVAQLGAGQVTIDEGSGVTVNVPATLTLLLAEQYAEATLTQLTTNVWIMAGNLEAA